MNRSRFLIEPDELMAIIGQDNVQIYDASIMFYMGMSPEEIAKMPTAYARYLHEHIPGAAFFDQEDFTDQESDYDYMLAEDQLLEQTIGRVGIANTSEVVVYAIGPIANATRAWWLLRYAGVENVRVLNGGLNSWKAAGGAVEQEERKYAPAAFKAAFKPEMIASLADVRAAQEDDAVRVENSLPRDWHDQEHIPGSACLPLTAFTDETWEVLKPDEQIRASLEGVEYPDRIITYCGGGIAATVNAMAHLMMGKTNVAVYDGSLYEWKGEKQPLVKGK